MIYFASAQRIAIALLIPVAIQSTSAQIWAKVPSEMVAKKQLPYANGKTFRNLNEYLDHVERRNSPIDLPWWRPIGKDRFEYVTSMRSFDDERIIATRRELLERFGFDQ